MTSNSISASVSFSATSDVGRFDHSLERLLSFGPTYAGGLSNHGPMALEALASLGTPQLYEAFLDTYTGRLEPADRNYRPASGPDHWAAVVRSELPDVVAKAGSQAGHGLLRVAHGVRSLERADTEVRRRELSAALEYWHSGVGLPAPAQLTGSAPLDEVFAALPRLSPDERRAGPLTGNLMTAARRDDVVEALASIAPADSVSERFDHLALAAGSAFVRNRGLDAFALLHGVTVTTMARVLLGHLDKHDQRRLEAAVTGFAVAAIVGFDLGDGSSIGASRPDHGTDLPVHELALSVASLLDDHHIKFADACAGLARRHPEAEPLIRSMLMARHAG